MAFAAVNWVVVVWAAGLAVYAGLAALSYGIILACIDIFDEDSDDELTWSEAAGDDVVSRPMKICSVIPWWLSIAIAVAWPVAVVLFLVLTAFELVSTMMDIIFKRKEFSTHPEFNA